MFTFALKPRKEMEETLKDKTAKGIFWGGMSNGLQQLLNLIFGIFLGRLLSPTDYGMVGMLTIFSLIAGSLQESGFTAAIANKKEVTHRDYNAVFWFSVLVSATLYILLFMAAPLIADFYHTPELAPLARYSFIGFFISSFGTAHFAKLFREMKVKQRTIATFTALCISGIVGVILSIISASEVRRQRQNLGIMKGLGYSSKDLMTQIALKFMPVIIVSVLVASVAVVFVNNFFWGALFATIANTSIPVIIVVDVFLIVFCYFVTYLSAGRIRKISVNELMTE